MRSSSCPAAPSKSRCNMKNCKNAQAESGEPCLVLGCRAQSLERLGSHMNCLYLLLTVKKIPNPDLNGLFKKVLSIMPVTQMASKRVSAVIEHEKKLIAEMEYSIQNGKQKSDEFEFLKYQHDIIRLWLSDISLFLYANAYCCTFLKLLGEQNEALRKLKHLKRAERWIFTRDRNIKYRQRLFRNRRCATKFKVDDVCQEFAEYLTTKTADLYTAHTILRDRISGTNKEFKRLAKKVGILLKNIYAARDPDFLFMIDRLPMSQAKLFPKSSKD